MIELEAKYRARRDPFLLSIAGRLEKFLVTCLEGAPRIDKVTVRAKTVESFLAKARKMKNGDPRYSDPINQIQDQIGARIVTFYEDDISAVRKIMEGSLRYIESKCLAPETESEFGYFGVHYIMILPNDVLNAGEEDRPDFFELQIKTLFQHAWSEAEHDLGYKSAGEIPVETKRKLAFTSAQAWGADLIFNQLRQTERVDSV